MEDIANFLVTTFAIVLVLTVTLLLAGAAAAKTCLKTAARVGTRN